MRGKNFVEFEFGEFLYQQVKKWSANKKYVRIGRMRFSSETGQQVYVKRNRRDVLMGTYLSDKRIHLGNGTLFSEDQKIKFYKRRAYLRERWVLIERILTSNSHDWVDITDEELLYIANKLGRDSNLNLKMISKP